jgi:alpha-tubulin suppressor-like RCC1 family protein
MDDNSPKEAVLKVKRWPKDPIAAGRRHTVGLKSNGTVVAVGRNNDGECNVSGWHDIVAVEEGYLHTIGLKSDGTVTAVG